MAKDRDDESELVPSQAGGESRPNLGEALPKVGDWYWVKFDEPRASGSRDEGEEWLGCVTHVGSNYVRLVGPKDEQCTYGDRVHFDALDERCRPEPRAGEIIAAKIAEQKKIITEAVRQISETANRLSLGEGSQVGALTIYRGDAVGTYKQDLVRAQGEGLPELRDIIQEASKIMKAWMQAEAIPLEAHVETYENALALVGKRIWGVELYAGLVEDTKMLREGGAPASADEPVHVFQRRHYMDEECLASYDAGGMSFADVGDFDDWLLRPENFQRILPHPRSIVAFRVRRHERDLSNVDDLGDFIKFLFGGDDKDLQTFLYMRNGDRLSRITTSMDFGEKLFPDAEHQVMASGTVYAVMPWSKVERLATEGEYLEAVRNEEEFQEKLAQISEDDIQARWKLESKHRRSEEPDHYVEWSRKTVYYDDISAHVGSQIETHNRLVLVLQGLLDRSEAFAPHPPYKLWVGDDFRRAVRLVYDDDRALSPGEIPDFESYRREANGHLQPGSLCVGQEEIWLRREAERENKRLIARYGHEKSQYMLKKRYWPNNNPGPGLVARVADHSTGRGCTFRWERPKIEKRGWREIDTGLTVTSSMRVETGKILCLDGYAPGDYKKFYSDPRTRARYLEWAPLLLRAEEYHAGKITIGKPSKE